MSHYFAMRRLLATLPYPAMPLYFESYSGLNDRYQWQNLGTAGGNMPVRRGSIGRMLTEEARPFYTISADGNGYEPWDIPNLSSTPSDYTFYLLMRGNDNGEDSAGVGAYLLDFINATGGDRTIFGYANPSNQAEIGPFYQFGQFSYLAGAPRAPNATLKIFTWVCKAGQPVRVYDETDALLYTSAVNYTPIAINNAGVTASGGNVDCQSLGSSVGVGRVCGADFGGFAAAPVAHTTKAERDAVRAKWRLDLNF